MEEQAARPCACPFCDHELAEAFEFCDSCGKEVRRCSSCGCAMSPLQNICPTCGARQ